MALIKEDEVQKGSFRSFFEKNDFESTAKHARDRLPVSLEYERKLSVLSKRTTNKF